MLLPKRNKVIRILFIFVFLCFIFSCNFFTNKQETWENNQEANLYLNKGTYLLDEDTETPRYDSAIIYLEKASALGSSNADRILAEQYYFGYKINADTIKAKEHIEKAIWRDDSLIYVTLAKINYYKGEIDSSIESLKKGDTVLTSDKRRVPIVNIHNTIVKGGPSTYPCVIQKNAVGNKEEFRISQNHLIKYGEYWVLPKTHFKVDKNAEEIHYYHIQLKKYSTDHLVINEGVVVESLAVTREDKIEYYSRIMQKSVTNVCRGEKKKLLA